MGRTEATDVQRQEHPLRDGREGSSNRLRRDRGSPSNGSKEWIGKMQDIWMRWGAQRIPDPMTAGDFTRRFTREDIVKLMESINTVRERGYENIRLESEHVAEFEYQPGKCAKSYRMVVLKKNLSVEKGEKVLFDDIRYYFSITTLRDRTAEEVVALANGRCDQENVIKQLKNGVNAMKLPVRDLESNWAYMVIASLAWNLKAWYGLLMPNMGMGTQVVKMEFRRFLNTLIRIPCQILRTGRKIGALGV